MPVPAHVESMILPIVESKGAFLVDVAIRNERGGSVLEVLVDTDNGITTALCAEISREISRGADLDSLFRHRYHLVVSSPGIDRPLKFVRQYRKNIGRAVKVQYRGTDGLTALEGELIATDDDRISVRGADGESRTIYLPAIVEIRVCTVW